MSKITILKTEYERLQRQAGAFRLFAEKYFEQTIRDPINEVVEDFKKTNLYTDEFLQDLDQGLRRSSYAKSYAHKTTTRRSRKVPQRASA